MNIEDIKIGDSVYSKNEQTGEKGLKKVVNTFIHDKDEIIKTTEEHPFYVEGKGFVDAEYLNEGDILVDYYGKTQRLESKIVIKLDKPIKVYNFEVEDWHTYFVTKDEIFVHNKAMNAKPSKNQPNSSTKGVSKGFKNYSAKEIERKFSLKKGQFHKIKQDIIKDLSNKNSPYKDAMKRVGNNPDIHLSSDGTIRIMSRNGKTSFDTN